MHSYAHWKETNPDGTVADYYRAIGLSPAGGVDEEGAPLHGFWARDYVESGELDRLHKERLKKGRKGLLEEKKELSYSPYTPFPFPVMRPPSLMNLNYYTNGWV